MPNCDSHMFDLHVMSNIQLFYAGTVDNCTECNDPLANCFRQNKNKFKCCPPGKTDAQCQSKNLSNLFHIIGPDELLDIVHNDYCQSENLGQSLN